MIATPSWVPWADLGIKLASASACSVSAKCFRACASRLMSDSTAWNSLGASFQPAVKARPVFHASCDSIRMSPTVGTVMAKSERRSCNAWEKFYPNKCELANGQ